VPRCDVDPGSGLAQLDCVSAALQRQLLAQFVFAYASNLGGLLDAQAGYRRESICGVEGDTHAASLGIEFD
jgi:hypothetical protein